jgi:hypothetical protein
MNTDSGSYSLIPEINMGEATVDKRVGGTLCIYFIFFRCPTLDGSLKSVGLQERQYRRLYADPHSPRYDHLVV